MKKLLVLIALLSGPVDAATVNALRVTFYSPRSLALFSAREVEMRNGGSTVAWASGATATNPAGDTYGSEGASLLIDGNNTSNKWTEGVAPNAVIVFSNNGTSQTIDAIRYSTADDTDRDPVSFTVEGSSNGGSTWFPLAIYKDASITASRSTWTQDFTFNATALPSVTKRYVKIDITDTRGGAGAVQASDFRLIDSNFAVVAWNGSASATNPGGDNYGATYPPNNLLDNNTSTKWYDGNATPSSVIIDNTTNATFAAVQFVTADNVTNWDARDFTISVKTVGGDSWETVATVTDTQFTETRLARSVPYTVTSAGAPAISGKFMMIPR